MKWQTYLMVSWVAAITAAVSFYIGTSNAVSDVTPPFECFFVAVGSWGAVMSLSLAIRGELMRRDS